MQQVNLYLGPTQKSDPAFGTNHIVKASLGLGMVLVIITSVGSWQKQTVHDNLNQSKNRLSEAIAKTESLTAKYTAIPMDPELLDNYAQSNRMIAAMRQVLDYLNDSKSTRALGFSTYFEGLARHVVPKVWLSGINITDGGLTLKLEGTTLVPKQLPKLLQLLKNESAFQGKMFSHLIMEKNKDEFGWVDFSIATKGAEESDNGDT